MEENRKENEKESKKENINQDKGKVTEKEEAVIISKNESTTDEKSLKINKIKFNILAIFAIIIFSIALTPVTFQNDTYYTIAIGKEIVETGTIDMKDHFSWHEDLPYTYPHWL